MLIVALAHHRLGERAQAVDWVERARVWTDEADRVAAVPTAWSRVRWADWNERERTRALQTEADEVIGDRSGQ